jgi:hypothetical protein
VLIAMLVKIANIVSIAIKKVELVVFVKNDHVIF